MLLNDTKKDLKTLLVQDGETQTSIAQKRGCTHQYVGAVVNQKFIVSKTFITLLEAMGYDVKIEYIKR